MSNSSLRIIFHVDMDAFFVSVEELFDPSLKGKPVVVGGQRDERGVVSAASYAARTFGVHSAMPLRTAAKLCPQAIFVNGHPERYREYSGKVHEVLGRFSPLVEMASVDEAYLDMTGTERLHGRPLRSAHQLHTAMKSATQLNCSVGIGTSRLIAKVSSAKAKPNGVLWVLPGEETIFLAPLAVGDIPGVGKVMEQKLHAIGIQKVGDLCQQYNAYFHSDTVQTMGHYKHDLKKLKVHGMTAAAHKFHGPKGIGFMYINKDKKIQPLVHGGAQERNMRGGTENTYGIIGLAKALEICYREMVEHEAHIEKLKKHMIKKLTATVPGVSFHGDSDNLNHSLYTVLNVSFPESEENEMMLFNLDLQGISASGGSACSSGATTGSHVLGAIYPNSKRGAVRFSFSKYNTIEEIDFVVDKVAEIVSIGITRI